MSSVYVAGSLNMDVVAFAHKLPLPGETLTGSKVGFFAGGKGLNSAIAAAKQGATVRLIGRLGMDEFGEALATFVVESGVDASLVGRSSKAATGTAIIMVAEGGENSIVVIPGTNALVSQEEVRHPDIGEGDVLLTVLEIPHASSEAFLRHGRERGARTILAAAPASKIGFLDAADVLIVNEGEAAFYAGMQPPRSIDAALEVARSLRSRTDQAAIVTLGDEGAVASSNEGDIHVPARRVEAVDATGAGDCFAGCVAARLSSGDSLEAAMGYASVAAAICVTRPGAAPSMPTREEVLAELA